jgi:hypothetical protein
MLEKLIELLERVEGLLQRVVTALEAQETPPPVSVPPAEPTPEEPEAPVDNTTPPVGEPSEVTEDTPTEPVAETPDDEDSPPPDNTSPPVG